MADRLYLRAFEPEDYKTIIRWRRDEDINNMLGGPKYFFSEENEKKWVLKAIEDPVNIKLAVCTIEGDIHIGNVYITDINYINRSCHSHILIGEKSYWGSGYATEAMTLLIDFMFNERGMNRIVANVLEDNIPSIKMHEKCGYKREGLLRQAIYKNGKFQNQIVLALLKEDYNSKHI